MLRIVPLLSKRWVRLREDQNSARSAIRQVRVMGGQQIDRPSRPVFKVNPAHARCLTTGALLSHCRPCNSGVAVACPCKTPSATAAPPLVVPAPGGGASLCRMAMRACGEIIVLRCRDGPSATACPGALGYGTACRGFRCYRAPRRRPGNAPLSGSWGIENRLRAADKRRALTLCYFLESEA